MPLTPDLVERAVQLIAKGAANYDYFFGRVQSPDWISPLEARGFFTDAPSPIHTTQGVMVRSWPPSEYLTRVASQDPGTVSRVILGLSTDNERVHEDFCEAATKMPVAYSKEIADKETAWLEGEPQLFFGLSQNHAKLVIHLAENGETESAFRLARELLRPKPEAAGEGQPPAHRKGRFEDWSYGEILDQMIPGLLQADPRRALTMLVDLLDQMVGPRADDGWDDDYFRVWRPRLDRTEEGVREPVQSVLNALRDATVRARTEGLLPTSDLLDLLLSKDQRIFHRVACYCLESGGVADSDLARVLVHRRAFLDYEPSPEYRALLESEFGHLRAADQDQLLQWIEEGRTGLDDEVDDDSRERGDIWRIQMLALIRDNLTAEWSQRYEELVRAHGEFHFGTSFEIHVVAGDPSPLSVQELQAMQDEELVDYLRSFVPANGWGSPTREGLARSLSVLGEEDPGKILRIGPSLGSLYPTYAYWSLHGVEEAARKGALIDWAELVSLLQRLTANEDPKTETEFEHEVGRWRDVRREAAGLLALAFDNRTAGVQLDLREELWSLLEVLTVDGEPDAAYESKYGGDNMDPATLALNTVRGRAMRDVVAYAMWVKHHSEDVPEGEFLSKVPEVRRVLEEHLDLGVETSAAVRSVYGQFFPWIFLIDAGWAESLIPRIFPEESPLANLRTAAWEAYVIWNPPYDSSFVSWRGNIARQSRISAPRPSGHGTAPTMDLKRASPSIFWPTTGGA